MQNNDTSRRQIKIGSMISYLTIILNIILGLIYTPWMLRAVGSSYYGLYTLASSLIALFLLDFGMSAAVSRYISNYRAQNNNIAISAFLGLSIKFYVVICTIIASVLFVVFLNIDSIYSNLTADELDSFKIVFAITAFFVVFCFPVNIPNGVLNAYEEYIWLKGTDVLNKIGTVVFTVIALTLGGNIYILVFLNGFFNLIAFIVKCIVVKKKTPVKISFRTKRIISFKDMFSFTTWTTINTLSQQMIFNLIPSILAMATNTLAITLYGFANVIEGYVYNITQAINGLFMPSISRLIVDKDEASDVLELMIKVGRVNQSVISVLLIGLIALGNEFVNLWVGDEYRDLYFCILFLVLPNFISASQQIANTSIVVLNKIKYSSLINLITGLTNLVLCYFSAQKFGVIGVCATIGFIFFVRIICLNVVYKKVLHINIWKFFIECHMKMFPAIILSALLGIFVMKLLPMCGNGMQGWLVFCVKCLILSVLCIVIFWLCAWNKYEKDLIMSFFYRKKH